MNKRKDAIYWWNDLSKEDKLYYMKQTGFDGRSISSLTGREIEMICADINEMPVELERKNIGTQRSPFGIGS